MTEPIAVLRRHLVVGQLRRVRLPHPAPVRAAPRRRGDDDAVQRVPVPAWGSRRSPCGCASTSRTRVAVAEFLAGHECVDWVSYAGLPDSPWYDRAKRYLPDGAGAVFAFGVKGGRAGRREVHRVVPAGEPPRQHRRRPHAGHPSRLDDPPAALRRGAASPAASRPTWCGSRSASRTSRTSAGTSTGRCRGGAAPVSVDHERTPSGWRSCGEPGRWRSSGCPPTRRGRATSSPPTSIGVDRLDDLVREPRRDRDPRPEGVPLARRPARHRPTSSTRSAASTTCRRSPRRRSRAARETLWFQLGLRHDAAAARAAECRPRRRPGPLPEDRARPLRRRAPPRRVRHRRHRRPPRAPRVAAWTRWTADGHVGVDGSTTRISRGRGVPPRRRSRPPWRARATVDRRCWRSVSNTTGSTRARGRAGTRTPTSRWASGATT